MDFERVLEFVNTALMQRIDRTMTEPEAAILLGAWQDQTYEEIAKTCGYSVNYLQRNAAPKFWKLLHQVLQRQLNKTNARSILSQLVEQDSAAVAPLASPASSSVSVQIDWGEAPDIRLFYGRATELETLTQWLLGDRVRMTALLGMGGIGKSSLAAKVMHQLAEESRSPFTHLIWRSLRNAPPLATVLMDVVPFVSNQQDRQATPERLLHWLRTHRCLVILDNLEAILQPGDRVGSYRPGYEGYGEFLRLLGESPHQSSLVITSREKPTEISTFEMEAGWVRSLNLGGSLEAALALIESRQLQGSDADKHQLCQNYGCSPLALKIVAASIHSLFDGAIASFLAEDTIIFNGLRRLLDQQFERLSDLEKSIMYWLAINREWTAIAELLADIQPSVTRSQILECLESLTWRSLIDHRAGRYTLQPALMEYVTETFIEHITTELTQQYSFSFFNRFALLKTTVKDYIQESQERLILGAIAHRLLTSIHHQAALSQRIAQVFAQLREQIHQGAIAPGGYAIGNLLNLSGFLQLSLVDYDFSGLTIQHANLKQFPLHRVNFANATFIHSDFIQNFSAIFAATLSPDGTLLATGEYDGTVRLWRIPDLEPLYALTGHANWVWSISFSPDHQLLATASSDCTIRVWDVATGGCRYTLREATAVLSVCFSPDGTTLSSGGADCLVKLWEVQTGALLQTWAGHSKWVWSVCFNSTGTQLASGSDDCTIKLWDCETGTCLKTLSQHQHWVWSVQFSPDDRLLASSSFDRTVRLWEVDTGALFQTLRGHQDWIGAVDFSPDGAWIASSSHDETVRLWEVQTGKLVQIFQGHINCVLAVNFSPDGETLVSAGADCSVRVWNVRSRQLTHSLKGYTNWMWSTAVSPDGQTIAAGCSDYTLKLWEQATGTLRHTLTGHQGWVMQVGFSPDGQWLVSSSSDYTIRLWDGRSGVFRQTLRGHHDWVLSVQVSPDGTRLASSSYDGTVKLWDVSTGKVLHTLAHDGWVLAVEFSPMGPPEGHDAVVRLVSGTATGLITHWTLPTGDDPIRNGEPVCELTWTAHHAPIWAVRSSPDGTQIASGSEDGTIKLWDAQTGTLQRVLQGHQNWVMSLDFHASGRLLVSGSKDFTATVWDVTQGTAVQTLRGHGDRVLSAQFHPTQPWVVTGSADGTVKLWDWERGTCLQTLQADRPYEGMNITGVAGLSAAQQATLKALGAITLDQDAD